MVITNTTIDLTNLNTGDTYGSASLTPISDSVNCIGEKKRIVFGYTTDVSFDGFNFYINPGLFMPIGAINPVKGRGSVFFECAMPSVTAPGVYPCNLNSSSTIYNLETFRNYTVSIEVFDNTTFNITVEFYQTYDVLGYMNSSMALDNQTRFLKDRYNHFEQGVVSGQSIYNGSTHDGRLYVYIENSADKTIFASLETSFGGYTAQFSDLDIYTGVSITDYKYFTTGSVPQEISAINLNTDTKVEITFNCPSFIPTAYILAFKKNKIDNTVDFIANSEAETAFIDPSQGDLNLMIGPFVAPYNPDVTDTPNYACSFIMNAGALEMGDEIFFMLMVYNPSGEPVSFSKSNGPALPEIPFNGEGFISNGFLDDYNVQYTGNDLECVVEERMRSKYVLDFPANQYKNDIFTRLGIVIPNDITTFLKKVNFTIYEDALTPFVPGLPPQTVKNVFLEAQADKIYGFPGLYILSGGTNILFDFSTTDELSLVANWRNRYETGIQCIRTFVNGVDYNNPLANQYWGGKTLTIEWKLTFDYNTLPVPFTDEVIFNQQIRVKGYEGVVDIKTYNPDDNAKVFLCMNNDQCFYSVFTPPDADLYRLINTIELAPGNILTIEEAEAWVGAELAQMLTPKIDNQDVDYGPVAYSIGITSIVYADAAKFCLVSSELTEAQYKISAMAKKVIL